MEREQAISFLLQAEPTGKLGVLAIVGPGFIGKSTFVEHVCEDERVRDYFSLILFYSKNDLKDETVRTFRDNCVIRHQNITSDVERSLVVIELLGDVDKGTWKRLLHTSERCMTHGSKIIITSRSENMASFGTTKAMQLNCLSREAYWYFFKMLVFGSMDLEEHPKLTSIAMELALEMRGSFISAYHVAAILRDNFSARFWCEFLSHVREHTQNNISLLGEYPVEEDRPRYAWSMAKTRRFSEDIKFVLRCVDNPKGPAAHGEVPRIPVLDLLSWSWSSMPGKFEILCWRSVIPPYYSYVYACEFLRHENTAP
jgi:GTPase SAR1 family protein